MRHNLSLQEQVLLLCLNDETGKFEAAYVDYGVDGAAFAELLLSGRLSVDEKTRVTVNSPTPVGDDLLDRALARLVEQGKARKLYQLIGGLYRGKPPARQALLDRLIDRGILTTQEGRVLWVFPVTRYPTQDAGAENQLRDRVRQALLSDGAVDQRLAMLISILQGCRGVDCVLDREERKRRKDRIRQVSEWDPIGRMIGKAVGDAVAAAHAAAASAAFPGG